VVTFGQRVVDDPARLLNHLSRVYRLVIIGGTGGLGIKSGVVLFVTFARNVGRVCGLLADG